MEKTYKNISVVSLNIETNKHISRILPFFQKKKLDVILLQEVFLEDLVLLGKELDMDYAFAPMKFIVERDISGPLGVGTLSSFPVVSSSRLYYHGSDQNLPHTPRGQPLKSSRCLLSTEILKNKEKYCFMNTHFTWSPKGRATSQQRVDLRSMLHILGKVPDFVLCGDFNAPRGRSIFRKIADLYKDNVPPKITSTLDKDLHKAGDLQLVVDGVFSTPKYEVASVEVVGGVSDHCAILAKVSIK